MNIVKGKRWRVLLAITPLALTAVLMAIAGTVVYAATDAYGGSGGCPQCNQAIGEQYGVNNQLIYVANGRASNVAVIDVGTMSIVDYIPVPHAPVNAGAAAGQTAATLDKTLRGLGINPPASIPDMFYWEIHGVVPSPDRGSIYAVGALSLTPSDWTMYQVDTKTHENTRQIPMHVSAIGYCGLEYDRNDESSGVLYATSMETGPADLASLFGLPLQVKDPLANLLNSLGLGGLLNQLETLLPAGVGGLSEENLAAGANTRFIPTDYNGDLSSSTCGIAWNEDGSRAFASQQFEPLLDTINWSTKTADGEILPVNPGRSNTQHQSTSAKSRDLVFTAAGTDGIAVYNTDVNALVARIDINSLVGRVVGVHGVEVAPGNDNLLYVLGRGEPTGDWIIDVSNVLAPQLIGGVEGGLDAAACGHYVIPDKENYYRASGKCVKPDMTYGKSNSYWASYADYTASNLSVNFTINTQGGTDARNVEITGSEASSGVTTVSSMPMSIGDVTLLKGANATIVYHVPAGVTSFRASLSATAEDPCGGSYEYPSASGVGVPPAPQA